MTKRMDVMPACKTCEHWRQDFPKNKNLGRCVKMRITTWPNENRVSVSVHTDASEIPVDGDEPYGTTSDEFGCRGHSDFVQMQMQNL